ncbi:MAG: hypothetical protein HXM24_09255, partial [Haemophilus parainfluenzae]|nr:hypothetical protein [Haemophilus parainfluenzae]
MTTNNQENGGIPSIDDTTSRNIVGEGVERKNSKLIKTVFVFSIVALLAGGLFMTVMNLDEQDKQQVELKKDEAIKTQANNMPSIADAMAEIKRQEAEQEAARLRAEEEERRRREQEEADRLARLREQQQVEQTIAVNQPESQDSGETREQPLTPHQRRMEGDTLITIDNGGSKEKSGGGEIDDMLAGGVYANGSAKKISNRNLLLIHG